MLSEICKYAIRNKQKRRNKLWYLFAVPKYATGSDRWGREVLRLYVLTQSKRDVCLPSIKIHWCSFLELAEIYTKGFLLYPFESIWFDCCKHLQVWISSDLCTFLAEQAQWAMPAFANKTQFWCHYTTITDQSLRFRRDQCVVYLMFARWGSVHLVMCSICLRSWDEVS